MSGVPFHKILLNSELIRASALGDDERVLDLLRKGAQVNSTNDLEETSLYLAAMNGHRKICELLLDHDAKIDGSGLYQRVFSSPAFTQSPKRLKVTIKKYNERPWDDSSRSNMKKDIFHRSPVIIAAEKGHSEVVKLLLERGANINTSEGCPLFKTSKLGNKKIVELLLKAGADPNRSVYCEESTPLHAASFNRHVDIVVCLLTHGANVNATDRLKDTPLHAVCSSPVLRGAKSVMTVLLRHGADLKALNAKNDTAFDVAVRFKKRQLIDLILSFSLESSEVKATSPAVHVHPEFSLPSPAMEVADVNGNQSIQRETEVIFNASPLEEDFVEIVAEMKSKAIQTDRICRKSKVNRVTQTEVADKIVIPKSIQTEVGVNRVDVTSQTEMCLNKVVRGVNHDYFTPSTEFGLEDVVGFFQLLHDSLISHETTDNINQVDLPSTEFYQNEIEAANGVSKSSYSANQILSPTPMNYQVCSSSNTHSINTIVPLADAMNQFVTYPCSTNEVTKSSIIEDQFPASPSTIKQFFTPPSTINQVSTSPFTIKHVPKFPNRTTSPPKFITMTQYPKSISLTTASKSNSISSVPNCNTAKPINSMIPVLKTVNTVEPVLKSVNTVDPVLKTVNTVDPVLKSVNTVDPVLKTVNTVDPVLKSGNTVDPVLKSANTVDPVSKLDNTVDPVSKLDNTVDPVSKLDNTVDPVSKLDNTVDPVSKLDNTVNPASKLDNTVDPVSKLDNTVEPISKLDNTVEPISKLDNTVEPVSKLDNTVTPFSKQTVANQNDKQNVVLLNETSLTPDEFIPFKIPQRTYQVSKSYRFTNVGKETPKPFNKVSKTSHKQNQTIPPPDVAIQSLTRPNQTLLPPRLLNQTLLPPHLLNQTLLPPHLLNQTLLLPNVEYQKLLPLHAESQTLFSPHLKNQSLPPPNVNNQALPPPHVNNQALPPPHVNNQALPPPHVNNQALPPHHVNNQALPPTHVNNQALPPTHVNNQALPPPHVNNQALPPPHVNNQALPPPHVNNQALPPPHVNNQALPPPHVNNQALPPPHVNNQALPPTHANNQALLPPNVANKIQPPPLFGNRNSQHHIDVINQTVLPLNGVSGVIMPHRTCQGSKCSSLTSTAVEQPQALNQVSKPSRVVNQSYASHRAPSQATKSNQTVTLNETSAIQPAETSSRSTDAVIRSNTRDIYVIHVIKPPLKKATSLNKIMAAENQPTSKSITNNVKETTVFLGASTSPKIDEQRQKLATASIVSESITNIVIEDRLPRTSTSPQFDEQGQKMSTASIVSSKDFETHAKTTRESSELNYSTVKLATMKAEIVERECDLKQLKLDKLKVRKMVDSLRERLLGIRQLTTDDDDERLKWTAKQKIMNRELIRAVSKEERFDFEVNVLEKQFQELEREIALLSARSFDL